MERDPMLSMELLFKSLIYWSFLPLLIKGVKVLVFHRAKLRS